MVKKCNVEGCDDSYYAKGFCSKHYTRILRHGTLALNKRAKKPFKVCEVSECGERHSAKGFCPKHYYRWKKYGEPTKELSTDITKTCAVPDCSLRGRVVKGLCITHYEKLSRHGDVNFQAWSKTPEEYFWEKVIKTENCWGWRGAKSRGYGTFSAKRVSYRAHRFSYELYYGERVPSHIPIHHKCGNGAKGCVNPEHLQKVTPEENTAEMLERNYYKKRIKYLEELLAENKIVFD